MGAGNLTPGQNTTPEPGHQNTDPYALSGQGAYTNPVKPEDYSVVDFTQSGPGQAYGAGQQANLQQMMAALAAQLGQTGQQAQGAYNTAQTGVQGAYNTAQTGANTALSGLQQNYADTLNNYSGAAMQGANAQALANVRGIGNQYGSMGAGGSGAARAAAAQGANAPLYAAQQNIAQLQGQQAGQLAQLGSSNALNLGQMGQTGAMGLGQMGQQNAFQLGQMGQQNALAGGQMGQSNLNDLYSQFSGVVAPQYIQGPSQLETQTGQTALLQAQNEARKGQAS